MHEMIIVAYLITILTGICLTTPVWFIPLCRVLELYGYPRSASGRVKRPTLMDWLNATGVGIFLGAFLLPLSLVLWKNL